MAAGPVPLPFGPTGGRRSFMAEARPSGVWLGLPSGGLRSGGGVVRAVSRRPLLFRLARCVAGLPSGGLRSGSVVPFVRCRVDRCRAGRPAEWLRLAVCVPGEWGRSSRVASAAVVRSGRGSGPSGAAAVGESARCRGCVCGPVTVLLAPSQCPWQSSRATARLAPLLVPVRGSRWSSARGREWSAAEQPPLPAPGRKRPSPPFGSAAVRRLRSGRMPVAITSGHGRRVAGPPPAAR